MISSALARHRIKVSRGSRKRCFTWNDVAPVAWIEVETETEPYLKHTTSICTDNIEFMPNLPLMR